MALFTEMQIKLLPKDPLFRLLFINAAAGVAIAGLLLGGIFYSNIGNLRVLVQGDQSPLVPVLMLAAGLIITLVSVVTGSAIMLLDKANRKGGSGGNLQAVVTPELALVPVRAARSQRGHVSGR